MTPGWVLEPEQAYKVTSRYGYRTDPVNGNTKFHAGIDIAAPAGSRIICSNDGVVTKSDWSESEGWNVKVKHHDGFVTSYLHMLQSPEVIVGDTVYRGQLLGYLGSTGKSTGNHLHFAVHDSNGASIDPVDYLNSETAPTRTMMAKAETVVKTAGSRSYMGAGAMLLVVVAAIYFSEKS